MIVQPDFLYALYILINGRLEASGIESVLVCFPSLPTTYIYIRRGSVLYLAGRHTSCLFSIGPGE